VDLLKRLGDMSNANEGEPIERGVD
jgi:hypothetical protein